MANARLGPLIVILGETGSGKTALAIDLAKRFNGEIIAADSRTVYKGMDIGTAKPSRKQQTLVRHHALDLVEPGQRFSVYDFQKLAQDAIIDITSRGKLPFLVGGSGLYVDAVLYDFKFRRPPKDSVRESLHSLSVSELQAKILDAGLPLPRDPANPRHLTRLLESGISPEEPRAIRSNSLLLGVSLPREHLRLRIEGRVDDMLSAGLVSEAQRLYQQYGEIEALLTPGYKALVAYIKAELSLDEAKKQFVRGDMQLAKRQRAWFSRNHDIRWLSIDRRIEESVELITTILNK